MNRELGDVPIEIDGQIYTMRVDFNALCAAEAELSTPGREYTWQQILSMAARKNGRAMRVLFWACLREHHPALTVTEVGRLIVKVGLEKLGTALEAGVRQAFPPRGPAAGGDTDQTGRRPIEGGRRSTFEPGAPELSGLISGG